MPRCTFHTQTPLEALLVEQALLLARQLQKTADNASDGQVLADVEASPAQARVKRHSGTTVSPPARVASAGRMSLAE